MNSVAGWIAVGGIGILLVRWLLARPVRGCICGRCHKSVAVSPRCVLASADSSAWIEFRAGPMSGQRVVLSQRTTKIGSVADNDIVLSDPAVSQFHIEILRKHGAFTLCDGGSTNGVYVNGQRQRKIVLAGDDIIVLGNSEFVFRMS